jgi:hypothetical protein
MAEEMESLHKNQMWDLVEFPDRKRAIGVNGCSRKRKQYQKKWEKSSRLA